MILDALNRFDPAGTAITVTAASTNVIDMGAPVERGNFTYAPLTALVTLQTTFTAGGAATLTVQMQGSPDNSTWYTLDQSATEAVANLVAGNQIRLPLAHRPPGTPLCRYFRLNYVVATGPMTAGTIEAELAPWYDSGTPYPSGFTANN